MNSGGDRFMPLSIVSIDRLLLASHSLKCLLLRWGQLVDCLQYMQLKKPKQRLPIIARITGHPVS
jgi:hypothetical protein